MFVSGLSDLLVFPDICRYRLYSVPLHLFHPVPEIPLDLRSTASLRRRYRSLVCAHLAGFKDNPPRPSAYLIRSVCSCSPSTVLVTNTRSSANARHRTMTSSAKVKPMAGLRYESTSSMIELKRKDESGSPCRMPLLHCIGPLRRPPTFNTVVMCSYMFATYATI